jgi:hypothetical protein
MSAGEKVFGALKTVMTLKEQLDGLGKDLGDLNIRVSQLAEAHGALRDRVSRLEGVIEGAAMASGRQPRIEG